MTLPATIDEGPRINPLLRMDAPRLVETALAQWAADRQPLAVLTPLLEWKHQIW